MFYYRKSESEGERAFVIRTDFPVYFLSMKHIHIQGFKEALEANTSNDTVVFIDVRTPAEHAETRIPGVQNMPLDELAAHANELKEKKAIYVHCKSGVRSQQAVEALESLGVATELINVDGGILAWEQAGYPTAK